jgi:integrase
VRPAQPGACGLRRTDTDLSQAVTSICWQITQLGWGTEEGAPKSEAGERQVALDKQTVAVLRAHRRRQDAERDQAGDGWTESGFEFTSPDGTPLHPASVTDIFELIAYGCGLPPIRLHDLRHFAATLALAAGVDIKVVQEQLGHSSRAITSDTYTTVLPEVARAAAEATAALLSMDATGTREPATSPQPGKTDTNKKKDPGETPGQSGCAVRDLNPEPAD